MSATIVATLRLSQDALTELRDLVQKLHANGGPIPFEELVALGTQSELRKECVTIDLEASETLGTPLVVLHKHHDANPIEGLSPRQTEIAALVAQGLSNKEIASRLFLSVGTVKDHVHNILEKTGLSSRSAIAAKSIRA